ncbi:MAG TPA: hypothetical protein VKT76_14100 [Bradyrhizobium sp.]|nr:hypothetical protein [Bradyrhizobium sp.]
MFRRFLVFSLFLVAARAFVAPQVFAQHGQDACARDVARFCRSHMNDDDLTVLACLKQHRAKLSKVCEKVLTDNGQ